MNQNYIHWFNYVFFICN